MAPALQVGDVFEVVGGSSKGGIIVRTGKETTSAEVPERLSTGSLVKALEFDAGRVHFEIVEGSGPKSGWVSTHFHDKVLLAKRDTASTDSGSSDSEESERSDDGKEALRWYSHHFGAEEQEETDAPQARRVFTWQPGARPQAREMSKELVMDMGLEAPQPEAEAEKPAGAERAKGLELTATFGYPVGGPGRSCYARFDVRDEVCRKLGGFKHGHVVADQGANNREFIVVGVKFDPQSGEERLWLQPQDAKKPGALPFRTEDLGRLVPVYKGLTQSIRKRAELQEVSFADFEAAEDSDGEGVLLCRHCRLPVGTNLYSDEAGNPMHAECMAQRVQKQMREKEEEMREKEATEKKETRSKYCIGWSTERIPSNVGPATKLGLDVVPRGMCCLMLQPSSEGHKVCVVPTVDPAASINLEYLSLALKVRYLEGREPTFSLDPSVDCGSLEVRAQMQAKNFEPKWLSGTAAGEVLFQSDYHLKELSMGEYQQPVVGMKSCFDYSAVEAGEEWRAREWYVVRKAEMQLSEDNVLMPYLKMGVEAREQVLGADGLEDKPLTRADHPLVRYAQEFSENFDLIAERKSVVYHLRELAKASLLAKFLLESEVELEESWLDLAEEAIPDGCMEIPQLWNERCLAQIRVQEGKILDSTKLRAPEHFGVYGGVKFGLDRFRLAGAVTTRPGLRAVPSVAARAAMPTLSMSDVRSMGMLVASMQGRGAPPPAAVTEAVAAVPGAPAARPSMGVMVPGMRPGAPIGPAPVRGAPAAGMLAQQLQGMLITKPGLEGRRARLDVPSLHGVDLCLDQFNLDAPVRVASQVPAGCWEAGDAISKAFWSSLESGSEEEFRAEDKALLRQVFNPHLSDRREEGDRFTPPDPSQAYVQKLRSLVKQEEQVRQQRKEHFFSNAFEASSPGPLFPCSWTPTCEITKGPAAAKAEAMRPRPDYVAQAAMFDHVLRSATPTFDKTTEEGLRFRMYRIGSLDIRTTQEHDGKELVGAVFSVRSQAPAAGRVQEQEKILKVSEYVENAQKVDGADALYRRSYLVLETETGSVIVTEKLRSGTVAWEENPEDLEDRNSLARFIRSSPCCLTKKATITVADMLAYKKDKGSLHGTSHSACKRYVQGAYSCARGLADRRSSGFGSKSSWHKGREAKNTQKETRKETRRAEIKAKQAAAGKAAGARAGVQGHKVIDPIVVGSWDDWAYGVVMAYDEQLRRYTVEIQMGSAGRESFQILCDGDWDLCLHPEREGASAQEAHALCGPDAEGHGKNWTLGEGEGDLSVYRIVLQVDASGRAQRVECERLGPTA